MLTVVTAALQRQYLQTELILWIRLVLVFYIIQLNFFLLELKLCFSCLAYIVFFFLVLVFFSSFLLNIVTYKWMRD
jgi:hypothetical protein